LNYQEALEAHVGKLSADITAANARAAAAEEKLKQAQFSLGEPSAVDTGAPKEQGKPGGKGLMAMVKRRS
jgi:hypothetical protein